MDNDDHREASASSEHISTFGKTCHQRAAVFDLLKVIEQVYHLLADHALGNLKAVMKAHRRSDVAKQTAADPNSLKLTTSAITETSEIREYIPLYCPERSSLCF